MRRTTRTPATLCGTCGYLLDAAGPVIAEDRDAKPEKDDFTLCMNCGAVYTFDEALRIRPITLLDYMRLTAEERAKITEIQRVTFRNQGIDLTKRDKST
jgi:hypothetical protein